MDTIVMTITNNITRTEARVRLERFIDSQVYQHWDHGDTLRDAVESGADDISSSLGPFTLRQRVEFAIEETFDEFFEEGFPHGGRPPELGEEIRRHVSRLVRDAFGPDKPKRARRKK